MTEKQKVLYDATKEDGYPFELALIEIIDEQTELLNATISGMETLQKRIIELEQKQTLKPIKPNSDGVPSCQSCGKQYPTGTNATYCNLCGQKLKG